MVMSPMMMNGKEYNNNKASHGLFNERLAKAHTSQLKEVVVRRTYRDRIPIGKLSLNSFRR